MGFRLGKLDFDGGVGYISTDGDTIREFTAIKPKAGLVYQLRYTNKKGGGADPVIEVRTESGEAMAGGRHVIDPGSNLGLRIRYVFDPIYRGIPITADYSGSTGLRRLLYRMLGYGEGGSINYLDVFSK